MAAIVSILVLPRAPMTSPLILAACVCIVVLLAAILVVVSRGARQRSLDAEAQIEQQASTAAQVDALMRAHSEVHGRLSAMGAMLGTNQSEFARTVAERLDQVSQRVGDGLSVGARATFEQLQKLEARLAVIDAAQQNIGALSEQVGGLRAILGNKQARGAFGQGQMEAIVRDALPAGAYSFQFTLKGGLRPDCIVRLPGDGRVLAIDAKFPLEAFEEMRAADTPEAAERAATRFRQDVIKHIKDVTKYLVPGETQEVALMFVPSEALYAELHDRLGDVMQRAQATRVLIVSPTLLSLAIHVVQGLVRDARMRDQAKSIQAEVGHLIEDVRRLADRVGKLRTHFGQTTKDFDDIDISIRKIAGRGDRIEQLEFDAASDATALPNPVSQVAAE
jgi:DNA recombination protein RmuC